MIIRIAGTLAIVVGLLLFGFLVGRAHHYEQADVERMEKRVVELEAFRCAFVQFEDGSVFEESNDAIREKCIALVRVVP